jgi:hypothetical protein
VGLYGFNFEHPLWMKRLGLQQSCWARFPGPSYGVPTKESIRRLLKIPANLEAQDPLAMTVTSSPSHFSPIA